MIKQDKILRKIINFANQEDNIRAVIMNGSRVNKNAPIDMFQDYDVIMMTDEPNIYFINQQFINSFGDLIIFQHNNLDDQAHVYLMLFKENFRIDMRFLSYNQVLKELQQDSLSLILLDKDKMLPTIPDPDDSSYFIQKPSDEEFNETTNEFWWCLTNVAKGIYRDELPYVKSMYEDVVRKAFNIMIDWYIGINYDFKINPGKFGKWYKKYLDKDLYENIVKTYSGISYHDIWNSVFTACEVFRFIGNKVADYFGYKYPINDDKNVLDYLKFVKDLKS